MTFSKGKHVYMASGFFNDGQKDLCDFIEAMETPSIPIYSPRIDGGVLKPDSSPEVARDVFESNKEAIYNCAFVLAVVDDFDPGVLWEMGYAHGVAIPMLAYSDVKGRGLNVMLAGGCALGFVNGRDDLKRTIESWNGHFDMAFPKNTWSGEIQ